MLSIGITVCDKDYKNIDVILQQIKERVHTKYEVIIIDNRELFKDEETSWKPAFQFGYNAFQFASRAKVIELAKGDYIWFVDGDDEVRNVKDFNYKEDVIVFSYNTYPSGNYIYKNCVREENLASIEMIQEVKPVLWNKFFKRELFSKQFSKSHGSKKIVFCEDTMWLYEALSHAKSLREVEDLIYFHKEGLSNKVGIITMAELRELTTGIEDAKKILLSVFDKESTSKHLTDTYIYLGSLIPRAEDIVEATKLMLDHIPKDEFRNILQENIYPRCRSKAQLQLIINAVKEKYGEEYPYKEVSCMVTFEDGHTEEYKFVQTIDFDDSKDVQDGEWSHNLSIVCLVYDGNKQFLANFISQIKENVKVKYEIIVVDNRDDKSEPLNYSGQVKVVKTEKNVGVLDGRRLGFEASEGDYVWFVDIDDYILSVPNKDYGDNDILVFPFVYNGEHNYDGREIISENDFFTHNTTWTINVLLWNKWIKREVLDIAYQDIPHFFCVYNEDTLVTFTALKYSKYLEIIDGEPIYSHTPNDSSTTLKTIRDTKSIDIMFAGFEDAVKYMKTNFEFCKELCYESPYNIVFYLDIMEKSDEKVLGYFAEKLISLYGKNMLYKAIEYGLAENKLRYNRIKSYFNYEETK